MSSCPDLSSLTASLASSDLRAHLLECPACRALTRMQAGADADAGEMSAECAEVEPLLAALSETEIEPDDRARIEAHLVECDRCLQVSSALMLDLPGLDAIAERARARVVAGGEEDEEAAARGFYGPIEAAGRGARPGGRAAPVVAALSALVLAAAAVALVLQIRGGQGAGDERAEEAERIAVEVPLEPSGPAEPAEPAELEEGQGDAPGAVRRTPPPPEPADPPEPRAGDEVFQPPQRRAEPAPEPAGDLPESPSRVDIMLGMSEITPEAQACGRHVSEPGMVTVRVVVAPSGRVTSATAQGESGAASCLERVVRTASFPRSRRGVTVNFPFRLQPPADEPRAREPRTAQQHVAEGQTAARAGQYSKALRFCQEALKVDPEHQDAAMLCVIAACNLKSANLAQRFLPKISSASRRGQATLLCESHGVLVDP